MLFPSRTVLTLGLEQGGWTVLTFLVILGKDEKRQLFPSWFNSGLMPEMA